MDGDGELDGLRSALAHVGRGDAAALKRVYDLTSAKLFGICLRILQDRAEAEDVLQEVYILVWRHSATYDAAKSSPVTWLAVIAQRRSIDRVRSRRPGRSAPLEAALHVVDAAPSALAKVAGKQEAFHLDRCIDELESSHRDAIRSAFLDGLTYEVLANRAGVPLGTMKSWIRRSLLKLRTCLNQ
jgi:RNA polymerase sigma factor (sigma-70 family)